MGWLVHGGFRTAVLALMDVIDCWLIGGHWFLLMEIVIGWSMVDSGQQCYLCWSMVFRLVDDIGWSMLVNVHAFHPSSLGGNFPRSRCVC